MIGQRVARSYSTRPSPILFHSSMTLPQLKNTRLRWTFDPLGDVFVVYNHNVEDFTDRWQLESNQLIVKVQYAFRW